MDRMIRGIEVSIVELEKELLKLGEHATWSPLDKGRTAVDQVAECALITDWVAQTLEDCALAPMDWEGYGTAKASLDTPEKALGALKPATERIIAALRQLPAEKAGDVIELPWGETYTLGELANIVWWNNTYHNGQICYIQTLLGI
ncbi:MAG: hypothetical protein ACKO14_09220 [Armatimonadota bacterium]